MESLSRLLATWCLITAATAAALAQPQPPSAAWRVHRLAPAQLSAGDTVLIPARFTPLHTSLRLQTPDGWLDTTYYSARDRFLFIKKNIAAPELTIYWRELRMDFGLVRAHKDTSWIAPYRTQTDNGAFRYNPYDQTRAPINVAGLNYSGSYARGLSFGNGQDLVLNSSFNMQLAGNLGEGVEIVAAISDNNVPIQPQGNTQQLQEFDKIFIQLRKNKTALTVGDYDLNRPSPSYFMNYYKRAQGFSVRTQTEHFSLDAGIAITRGQFVRQTLVTIEGNQGPYKLRGANGEQFIIVLAGTERVYVDGALMTRGGTNDYTIDYNRGEITFTPKRLITKDRRVVIEFEYNDQQYNRSLWATNALWKKNRWEFHLHTYQQQDSRTATAAGTLTEAQRLALSKAGKETATVLVSGIDSVAFDANRILYALHDTLVNGQFFDSILVYSTSSADAVYEARFSEVGTNKGNYIRLPSAANGAVYGWVAPDSTTGIPSGNYAPIVRLAAPVQQQLYALGGRYKWNERTQIAAEVTLSRLNLNRLAPSRSAEQVGIGASVQFQNNLTWGNKAFKPTLQTRLAYEGIGATFRPIAPYRNQEFARDWNTSALAPSSEHLLKANWRWQPTTWATLQYELSGLLKDTLYNGLKNSAVFQLQREGWQVQAEGSWLKTQTYTQRTAFSRPKVGISKRFDKWKKLQIGVAAERERNTQRPTATDTLTRTSFYYDLVHISAQLPLAEGGNFNAGGQYVHRIDYTPTGNAFAKTTIADDWTLNGTWQWKNATVPKHQSQLGWNLTYRKLNIARPLLTSQTPQTTYLGQINWNASVQKGFLRLSADYQLGTGQEQKIQYNYLKVEAGQGNYVWIDRNSDGIKQLDEFEVAVFQDQADHLRVTTLTNEYLPTNVMRFNQNIAFTPRALLGNVTKGWKGFANRWSSQSTLQLHRKVRPTAGAAAWNPLVRLVADTALVVVDNNIRHALFFNRAHPKFGFETNWSTNTNRLVLTSGYESRQRHEWTWSAYQNWSAAVGLRFSATGGTRSNDSELFQTRNYDIRYFKYSPELQWTAARNDSKNAFQARTIATYRFKQSDNRLPDAAESATAHDLSLQLTVNTPTKSSLRTALTLSNIRYTGIKGTPLEYAMLEGLQNGRNWSWNATYQRTLANNLELTFSYEGRKINDAQMVHIGRANVRAVF